MALAAFQSDQQALDFLYGGPVAEPQLDIAPEPPVEMELGPDRLMQAADAAFLDDLDARGEPRLPQEDEDLPPVVPAEQPQATAPFASDEEALAFLSAGAAERRVETPRPTLEAEQTSGPGFGSDEEALAFLQGAEQRAPEIKLPAPRPTPKPVTTPEAADGTDVTFDAKGPAFQFTGSLVVDPSSGPEQGLDGMVPVAARGPVAATAAAGQAEPVLNRRPRLVPSAGGQIVFDQSSPERFTQGVEEAFAAGILPQSNYEKIKADEAKIFKVMDDRRKLEEKAQADPRLLAILQGAGRGGAMTLGAVGGAKLLATGAGAAFLASGVGAPLAPAAAVVAGTAGAIGGGIAAGVGYDALYKKLGEHFTEYDDVMKAAELFPMHKARGEMGMVALALPVSVAQGARGLRTAFQDGGLPQVARTAATAAGLGAGTGVVAYPIDAAVRSQEITPGGFATAAGVGALTGGFFLNNRMAGAKDVAAVAAKMKAGTPLTAAETKLAQAAQPAISAAIARMDTAGGVRTGPLEVEVPMTSVAGLVPSVGRAAARVPYRVPVKLPAGAVARAKADVPQALPAPGKAAAADVPVPRTAPVNVLPSGTVTIPMPGPAPAAAVAVPRAVSAAMAEPFNWALDTANERGIDLEETETDNWNALLSEHLQIVKSAIDAGEPVSVKAFQVYDLSVPFYDLDPATGTATLNAQTLRDYEEYLGGQDADYRESMADAGAEELLAAVIDLGGLPAPKSGAKRAVWSGELKALYEEAKGAGKGKGGDNQKGVFINKLFRRDGMDLDEMAMALKAKGFRVETEADLIELLGNRLRSGREIFGMATQSMEDVPLEMRGARPRRPTPGPAVNPYRLAGGGIQIPFRASSNFDPNLQQFEDRMRAVVDDPAISDNLYNQIPDSKGGKVIGTDIYRNVLPEYAQGREGRIGFVNATGRVAQAAAKDRLWREINNRGDRKVLLFTAGGVAAGKSTAVTDAMTDRADLVFDGTLRETEWGKQTIQQALDNGWDIEINYVQRPLNLVARGAIRRAQQEGRWGPYASVPDTHAGAQASIIDISKAFSDNPRVKFKYFLNDGLTPTDKGKILSLKDIDRGGKYSYDATDERISQRQDLAGRPDRGQLGSESKQSAEQGQESGGGSPFAWRVRGYSPAEHLEIFREAARSGDFEPRILRLLAAGNPALEQVVGETAPTELRGSRAAGPAVPTGGVMAGGGDAAATTPTRVEERPDLTLAPPDPQAYFDFSNVPASKQPAGNAAVQAAVQASDQPYQAAPVSAAGGVAGDVGLADARSRQAAAYRALLGGDAATVADAIKNGVPLSRLMLGFITRESAPFNIRGAIVQSPRDLAMYNLAHRTPFFESLKVAVLDDRAQVVHSQVVSVGTMNESLAHPRDFMATVLAAQQANPQAKLTGFMIMHNHPSGKTDPSDPDRAITRRFAEAGEMLGVPLIDHVITNGETYFSFREHGLIQATVAGAPFAPEGSAPLLPVLPPPQGQIGPGQMAAFEAVPTSVGQSLRMGDPEKLALVQQTLQTADPNMIHVINLDTRYGIVSVIRHPLTVTAAEIMKATTPAGAYAMIVSLPKMPEVAARGIVREVRTAADLMQIFLLDAAMPGMPASFKEMGLLEMPDAPYAVSSRAMEPPGSLSSDPLTPPASVRSGGGSQVPPGAIPVGMAALQTPDWVLARGETSAGRRLIKGVENFRPGQRWGFRSIVDFVNEAVRLEMRRSTTQTSRTHPAHYKPANHVAYTRETQSQINFHEAGHGLEYLLRARLPDVFVPHAAELIALTNRPGSMASDPPASLSPEGQRRYRMGEGVAEWTRLLLTDPATVQNLQVSAAISAAAERFYPGMAKSLRDAARAVNAFQGQDVATRWAMFNAPPNVRPSANELVGAIIRGGEAAVNAIASGAPVSSLDRKITRAIIKQRKETETAYKAALTKARLVRSTNLTPLMSAYNMILSIGAETQLAISGTGTSKGLRIVETAGKFRYLTGESWTDLRKKVPASKLAQFDQAAWAQESLNRWENGGLEYPGMREGILPEDLKAIVAMAVQDIPNFTRMYKEQSRFHDLILEVKEAGGLISGMDRARMQGARPGYWPLPRVMTAGRGAAGRGRGDMSAGVYRARGSGEAIRNIDEVTEERTREMFEAYYWNRFGLKLYDNMAAVAKDLSLPAEARILAGSTMVKMKMPMKAAASVSKEEALGWVMKSIGDAYEKVLGFRPEVKAEDVNLSWSFRDVWRPVKPTDVNVVSLLRDGVREYYQLGDPAIFGLFASPQTASKMGKAASWLLGPMTQNWKRNITQGLVFGLRNLFRDTFTQQLLNPDPIGWVPGWAHTKGVVNKFTKKYPQVFSEGLLLSRVQPSEQEMLASIKHGAIWQWLSEGFYVSQAKDPVIKTVATVLQPSNWLFPLWKAGDLINLISPGAATGALIGGSLVPAVGAPIGAAVGAVLGPAVGFTGSAMAQFFETAGREGAAVAALQRGATDEEALAKYWTASGQFNEHSGIADARIAMSIPGFLNPMLQGVRNVGQKLSDPDPAVRGTAWTRLLVMVPAMFGAAAIARYLMMDEEEKERERQRVVDDRLSFMDLAGFSVPFPYGPEGVMGSVVYNATMDDLLGRPKVDADRTAIMMLKRIVDPGSGLQFFGPQLATIMEANMNWSTFRQKHIVAPWMVQLPASEQYYSTTPEFYRKVGTMMNYSPAKLQYIVQQALSRQADETLRLAESIDRGRPMMEMADVPFVGRLFIRDPIGFGSQAVRSVTAVEDRLRLLDERLKAKGWNMLRDPEFPAEDLGSDQLRHLQVQLAYMEDLRKGMGVLSGMQGVAKYYSLKRDFANERNMRTVQTRYAQSLLIGNRGQIAELEKALELLKQVPQGSPDQVAAEYLNRRF